jgi:putative nucleotidyltransferase with HDIG domain/PAS domain S-box-containing protein
MGGNEKFIQNENENLSNESQEESLESHIQKVKEILRNVDHLKVIENFIIGFALHEIILDKDGKPCNYRYLYVNPAFEKITGVKKENIIGRTVLELFPNIERFWIDTYGEVAMTGKYALFEQYTQPIDKSLRVYTFSPKKGYFISFLVDITDVKEREKEIEKLLNFEKALVEINELLLRADNEEMLYEKIGEIILKTGIAKDIWIGLIEEGNFDVKPVAGVGPDIDYFPKLQVRWDDSPYGCGAVGTSIKTGKPIVIDNAEFDERLYPWREELLKRNIKSVVSIPLTDNETTIGAMVLYSDKENAFGEQEIACLKIIADDIVVGAKEIRLNKSLKITNEQLRKALYDIVRTTAKITEIRDPYTAGHQRRVSQLATAIAKKMNLPKDKIEAIQIAGLLHDIGKISIPADILVKPRRLNEIEFALIKEHSRIGYEILQDVSFPWDIANIVLQHHERLDGSGYPQGLKDGEILLEARIIAVADVVEAMCSHRPYRPALSIDSALEEISKNKGKLYDKDVVDACIKLFKEEGFKFEE